MWREWEMNKLAEERCPESAREKEAIDEDKN